MIYYFTGKEIVSWSPGEKYVVDRGTEEKNSTETTVADCKSFCLKSREVLGIDFVPTATVTCYCKHNNRYTTALNTTATECLHFELQCNEPWY